MDTQLMKNLFKGKKKQNIKLLFPHTKYNVPWAEAFWPTEAVWTEHDTVSTTEVMFVGKLLSFTDTNKHRCFS